MFGFIGVYVLTGVTPDDFPGMAFSTDAGEQ
jgi:hypothetical protein